MKEQELQTLAEKVAGRIFVPLEASGRHVHITRAQAEVLFGHGLTEKRPLSQPGQYLAKERLALVGPKGEFQNVAVLGPERKEAQVEISLTDGRQLGVEPPVRLSGKVTGTPGITLVGEKGRITLEHGVIAAQRHIHLSPEAAKWFSVSDGQVVKLQALTARPCTFEQVVVRVSPEFAPAVHLDYDESNACGFAPGDYGRILP